ncbi:MAG: T9SS type A sorting domain-containing protein, partial [Bacteroidales bacterium]|nr:T9SS type A sorting domain-containing protein [Bacteroidales bacterium]
NVVRPIWTRLQEGNLSVWTALIDVDALISTDISEQEIIPMATLEPNYPNPFMQSTYISFKLKQPGNVSLKVFDMYGKEVVTLINDEFRNPGKYVEHFEISNINLSSGVYYFALAGKGINLKRKMMLVR